ncbi:MAG: hypothetical protein IJU03_11275 [Thermoguttaceae bacterium]|nr:hypothetical protein [Thermoguttaceae bacterium]
MSVLFPKPGDMFYNGVRGRNSFFQILANYDCGSSFVIRTIPPAPTPITDRPVEYFREEQDPSLYAYSFLEFEGAFEFHSNFEFIGSDPDFNEFTPFRPIYVMFPHWRETGYNYIPPTWSVEELEYVDNYARKKKGVRYNLGQAPLPERFHNSALVKEYNHGQYLLGMRHPYDITSPSPGILSIRGQVDKWTNETIKIWNQLFEERYKRANWSEMYDIDQECEKLLFRKGKTKGALKSGSSNLKAALATIQKRSKIQRTSPSMFDLREEATCIVQNLRDYGRFRRDTLREFRDILNAFLKAISGKQKDEKNMKQATRTALLELNELHASQNRELIDEETGKLLATFFSKASEYVGVDVAEIVEEERDWQ